MQELQNGSGLRISALLFENRAKRGRFVLEFGHLGRILARSPRFFRNVFSINTGLPDLASGPFCAEGVRPEGPRAQAKAVRVNLSA